MCKKKTICLTSLSIGLKACDKRLITLVNHLQRGSFLIVLSPQEISANELPQGKSSLGRYFFGGGRCYLTAGCESCSEL